MYNLKVYVTLLLPDIAAGHVGNKPWLVAAVISFPCGIHVILRGLHLLVQHWFLDHSATLHTATFEYSLRVAFSLEVPLLSRAPVTCVISGEQIRNTTELFVHIFLPCLFLLTVPSRYGYLWTTGAKSLKIELRGLCR